MPSRIGVWAAIATAWWLSYGLVNAANFRRMTEIPWQHALTVELTSTALWIPFTVLVFWLAERFPLGRPTPAALLAHMLGLAVTVAGRAAAVVVFNPWVGWYEVLPPLGELFVTSVGNNLFPYAFVTGAAHALHYARAYRVREAQLAQARLAALQAQVRPHFLFNALNTIAAFVPTRPAEAERMITQLSTLLRRALDADDALEVPLRTELELVRAYLDIEQARFGDRLRVAWEVDEEAEPALVPPLLLQPLVENAVRHGLLPQAAPGTLTLTARRDAGGLRLRVGDDGVGLTTGGQGGAGGIGLANVRARLGQLYPGVHRFTVDSQRGGGTVVSIDLPYRKHPPA